MDGLLAQVYLVQVLFHLQSQTTGASEIYSHKVYDNHNGRG